MQWLLPVVFRVVVFKLLVWCEAEGYVSGLQHAAEGCKYTVFLSQFLKYMQPSHGFRKFLSHAQNIL